MYYDTWYILQITAGRDLDDLDHDLSEVCTRVVETTLDDNIIMTCSY